MHKTITSVFLLAFLYCSFPLYAASVVLQTRDALAWLPQQTVKGSLVSFTAKWVTVHHDAKAFTVAVNKDNSFTFSLVLHDHNNRIWVVANDNGKILSS